MGGPRVETAAEALLVRLAQRGVEFVLANAGTDFAPLIEGLCRLRSVGTPVPEMLPIAHESVAVAMAHGYWLVTGRPQAVMLHTNVGLANAVMGLINAAADEVPILALSGRTPVTETGRVGSRDLPIHWGQEMRDQAAMVRELTKWDYELRFPEQVADLVDRALAIAASPPRGPVYLSLPREVLCAPRSEVLDPPPRQVPATSSRPDPAAIAEAAAWLAGPSGRSSWLNAAAVTPPAWRPWSASPRPPPCRSSSIGPSGSRSRPITRCTPASIRTPSSARRT